MEDYFFTRSGNRTVCWYSIKSDLGFCVSAVHEDPEEAKRLALESARERSRVIPIQNLATYHLAKKRRRGGGKTALENRTHVSEPGRLVTTNMTITDRVRKNETSTDLTDICLRHHKCDWGDVNPLERTKNDIVLRKGSGEIVARYTLSSSGSEVCVVTDLDRSLLSVMYPDEYRR